MSLEKGELKDKSRFAEKLDKQVNIINCRFFFAQNLDVILTVCRRDKVGSNSKHQIGLAVFLCQEDWREK